MKRLHWFDFFSTSLLRLNQNIRQGGKVAVSFQLCSLSLLRVQRAQTAVTSALVGASRVAQVEDSVSILEKLVFTREELESIKKILIG